MTKVCTTVLIGMLLLISVSCSSVPEGTMKIADIQKDKAAHLGKEVVIVGMSETKTSMSSFKMFKIYQGSDFIWVLRGETSEEPLQGVDIRVTGTLKEGEFNLIGKVLYLEASKIRVE